MLGKEASLESRKKNSEAMKKRISAGLAKNVEQEVVMEKELLLTPTTLNPLLIIQN